MKNREMLYEGKAKNLLKADDDRQIIISYKDETTAFNGVKKINITNKGILNNAITAKIFQMLEENGIRTHYLRKISPTEQLCKKLSIIPLEVIMRNTVAGSMAHRLGLREGMKLTTPIYEISYKSDRFGYPLINDDHAVALGLTTYEELSVMKAITHKINGILIAFFEKHNIRLIDFKIEFGRDPEGNLILANEISPDTCRLWDLETGEKLDKDRFRKDMGKVEEAYLEILTRISA